jgi:hydroxyacylglutathione hydrolase
MFQTTAIPAFHDNYIWALQTSDSGPVCIVDPGDATPVLRFLQQTGSSLDSILITHHHQDHTGGLTELLQHHQVPVFGPADSPISGISHPIGDGDSISVLGQTLRIKQVPGHTLDHLCYYHLETHPQLFCGDTLFLAGCGRLFEGSPAQMLESMRFFRQLPDNTEVYCAHEYSLANLAFARVVEPDNKAIRQTQERCTDLRNKNTPTLPSSIGTEKRINPFMRTEEPGVIAAAQGLIYPQTRNISHLQVKTSTSLTQEQVFTAIREWKNNF